MHFFVTCARGTEGPLRRELVGLRIHAPRGETGGVSFDGSFTEAMRVCLWSRVGMRVLLELRRFSAEDADALYGQARQVEWTSLFASGTTLAVSAAVQDSPTLRHSGFAALRVKDAVVDALRDRTGQRPDVRGDDPDVALFLHLRGSDARLYADLAGTPLHRRGYRAAMIEAPLKETLAAAVLALGGVPPDAPFVDPMCGSGTLPIEQALAARNIAPGLRRRFGFERWPDQSGAAAWLQMKEEARQAIRPARAPITGRDVSPEAIRAARRNAGAAGVAGEITFEVADIESLDPPAGGTVCFNPPYGERLDTDDELYRRIGRAARRLGDARLVVLSGNPRLARAIGRKPAVNHKLYNGPLEVRLLVWPPTVTSASARPDT